MFQITQAGINFAWMVNITLTIVGVVAVVAAFWC